MTSPAAAPGRLAERVARQTFCEDLSYRLGGAQFTLPPLRERADLGDPIRTVFAGEAQAAGHLMTLDPALAEALGRLAWPGNLRQLRHTLRHACAVCDGTRVGLRHLPADLAAALVPPAGDARHGADDERARIVAVLNAHRWHPNAAAAALGISRATLYRRIARLGIVPPIAADAPRDGRWCRAPARPAKPPVDPPLPRARRGHRGGMRTPCRRRPCCPGPGPSGVKHRQNRHPRPRPPFTAGAPMRNTARAVSKIAGPGARPDCDLTAARLA